MVDGLNMKYEWTIKKFYISSTDRKFRIWLTEPTFLKTIKAGLISVIPKAAIEKLIASEIIVVTTRLEVTYYISNS